MAYKLEKINKGVKMNLRRKTKNERYLAYKWVFALCNEGVSLTNACKKNGVSPASMRRFMKNKKAVADYSSWLKDGRMWAFLREK